MREKGWSYVYPKDKMIIMRYVDPCTNASHKICMKVGTCMHAMGEIKKGKKWFNQCKYIEIQRIDCSTRIMCLANSPIKFRRIR